jgi:phosphatidylinositol alpha-1,6-mannosyltransferase
LIQNPDAVMVATTWELGAGFRFLKSFFPKAKLVLVAHGKEVTQLKRPRQIRRFQKTLDVSEYIVAVSRFTQEAIRKQHPEYPADQVYFVPNGVDPSRFYAVDPSALREQLGIAYDDRVILTLARMIERKGHDTVLQSLPQILEKHSNTRYLIAGPWKEPFYKKLQAMIHTLDLDDHVIFTGFVEDADLNAIYSLSDVYVMVSRETGGDSEGFGITFLEAGACGCPVIGSRSGGIEDAVEDNVNGYLIDPDDPNTLAEKVLHLFDDPILSKRIGDAGRKRVEEGFTWGHVSERLLSIVENKS